MKRFDKCPDTLYQVHELKSFCFPLIGSQRITSVLQGFITYVYLCTVLAISPYVFAIKSFPNFHSRSRKQLQIALMQLIAFQKISRNVIVVVGCRKLPLCLNGKFRNDRLFRPRHIRESCTASILDPTHPKY